MLVGSAVAALGRPTPPLMAVLAEPEAISVLPHLDREFPPPPPPWSHVPDIDSWTCDPRDLRASVQPARRPVLLPLGVARGGVLLVNLEAVSPLTVTGDPDEVAAVLRAWVMNLLLVPHRIVAATAAATAQLATVGSGRFIAADDADALRQRLDSLAVQPDVVVLDDADPGRATMFPTACVVTTAVTDGAWQLRVNGRRATLANDHRNLALSLDSITAIDGAGWGDLLAALHSEAHAAAAAPPVAPPPAPERDDTVADADAQISPDIWVRLLGAPAVTPPDGRTIDDPGRSRVWTSVIAYLATVGRGGATREDLRECWGHNSVGDQSIRQTVSRIRGFLGEGPDGRSLLPELGRGGRRGDFEPPQAHRLDPMVLSDWERWQQLVGDSPTTASDDALAEALALVRGPAFDVPPTVAARYEWAKFLKDDITDAVPDAALELATRRAKQGDQPGTVTAALAGVKANPQRQDLWRLALKATTDKVELAALADQLRRSIPSDEIEPPTRKLLP